MVLGGRKEMEIERVLFVLQRFLAKIEDLELKECVGFLIGSQFVEEEALKIIKNDTKIPGDCKFCK